MGFSVLALIAISGSVRSPVRAPARSAVTMGPIRAIKRAMGIQKQNFLEATVRLAARAAFSSQ